MKHFNISAVLLSVALFCSILFTGCKPVATPEDPPVTGENTETPADTPSSGTQENPTTPSKKKYTVIFNINDGSETPATFTQKFYKDEEFELTENSFTRTGYEFLGWAGEKEASEPEYTDKAKVTFSGSKTLYAVWVEVYDFTITYYPGFEESTESKYIQTVTGLRKGKKVDLQKNRFSREGFVFLGWGTSSTVTRVSYTDEQSVSLKRDTALYGIWFEEAAAVTITYNKNDDTENPETVIQYVNPNQSSSYVALRGNTFEREGYEFLGWAETSDAETKKYNDGYSYFSKPQTDTVLYAVWQDNTRCTIVFNANYEGADPVSYKQYADIDFEEVVLNPLSFEREGYVFLGWANYKGGDAYYSDFGKVTRSIYDIWKKNNVMFLYAVWLEETSAVKIIYNKNDETEAPETVIQYVDPNQSSAYVTLRGNTFERENYTFLGWAETPNAESKKYNDGITYFTKPTADVILYAVWQDDLHWVITFKPNYEDSTETPKKQLVDKSTQTVFLDPNTFVREGYRFVGWGKDQTYTYSYNGGSFLTDEDKMNVFGNYVLNAIWETESSCALVTFNANGAEGSDDYQYVPQNKYCRLKPNKFAKENYSFTGWLKDPSYKVNPYSDSDSYFKTASDITLYAYWNYSGPVEFTFYGNGGKTPDGLNKVVTTVIPGPDRYATLPENTFIREGYLFKGWGLTSSSSSAAYSDNYTYYLVSEPTETLYALWDKLATVTFDGNGGTTEDESTSYTQQVKTSGYNVLESNRFEREGYCFYGWAKYKSSSGKDYLDGASNFTTTDDITLYAVWRRETKDFVFNPNGGEGESFTVSSNFDTENLCYSITLPVNEFTKEGYDFVAWSEFSAPTGKSLLEYQGATLSSSTYDDCTLYAVWRRPKIQITFNANNNTTAESIAFADFDESYFAYRYTLPECAFEYEGYSFAGWYTSSEASSSYYLMTAGSVKSFTADEDIILFANWAQNYFTITYVCTGLGRTFSEQIPNTAGYKGYVYAPITDEILDAGYDYYSFKGWSTTENAAYSTYKAGDKYLLNRDKTLYDVWELGTIINDETSYVVPNRGSIVSEFTLIRQERLIFDANASGEVDYWLVTPENKQNCIDRESFQYFSAVSKENATRLYNTITLSAGTYCFIVQNDNYINDKTVTRKVKGY